MISLKTRLFSGMKSTEEKCWVNIPPKRNSGHHGGTERDQYVCRFLGARCRRHPSIAVFLARVGSGTRYVCAELGRMCRIKSQYSHQFGLDCVTAAVVDAVYQALGQCSTLIFARRFEGPQMHKSLRYIVQMAYEPEDIRRKLVPMEQCLLGQACRSYHLPHPAEEVSYLFRDTPFPTWGTWF